ncbi:MAG: hypothetical protein H6625_03090 [Bdellovibrionaceae bacterium]|nr:hypothetical protein [Pseudobdellovibrionaceae bacterium]
MKLRLATEDDSDNLIKFYEETLVTTPIHLKLHKQGSFFFQYKMQSKATSTYILVDDKSDKKIKAMVNLLFREAKIDGVIQQVGYVTDLRIASDRKVILEWTRFLLPTLREAKKAQDCRYIFSVVGEAQQQAMNAFIRPRNVRRELPRYYLYRKFSVVSLHALWPWALDPLPSIQTEPATVKDLPDLAEYVSKKNSHRTPNYHPSPEHFLRNLELWGELKIEDFLLAKDGNGSIVGCTALWNSHAHEQFIAVKYDSMSLTLKEMLHLYSYFSSARRLPDVGTPLNFYYLSYLLADNSDIFYSLCHKAYHSVPKTHFLVYPHFEGSLMSQPARSFISSNIKAGLYCLLDPEESVPNFLKPRVLSPAPDFELAFI